jgi:hypothetical protein
MSRSSNLSVDAHPGRSVVQNWIPAALETGSSSCTRALTRNHNGVRQGPLNWRLRCWIRVESAGFVEGHGLQSANSFLMGASLRACYSQASQFIRGNLRRGQLVDAAFSRPGSTERASCGFAPIFRPPDETSGWTCFAAWRIRRSFWITSCEVLSRDGCLALMGPAMRARCRKRDHSAALDHCLSDSAPPANWRRRVPTN